MTTWAMESLNVLIQMIIEMVTSLRKLIVAMDLLKSRFLKIGNRHLNHRLYAMR